MADIYDQHAAAFTNVSAYVILKDGERVATVAIKFPRDGAGRLWAYCHWLGVPMERAYSSGYGYDKRTPAVLGAFQKAKVPPLKEDWEQTDYWRQWRAQKVAELEAFQAALKPHDGTEWDRQLRDLGYEVLQAV